MSFLNRADLLVLWLVFVCICTFFEYFLVIMSFMPVQLIS